MSSNNKQKFGQFYTTNYNKILKDLNYLYTITENKNGLEQKQFYTNLNISKNNNSWYEWELFEYFNIKKIIEPFVGNGDLIYYLNNITNLNNISLELYDIDPPKNEITITNNDLPGNRKKDTKIKIIKKDTIKNPPNYKNSFIITNPPYLARNKSNNKELFNKYDTNDLYKCFLYNLIENPPIGGILIIPLNFLCSIRNLDVELRDKFLSKFWIHRINIFEEKVFDDTSYTVCSFIFENISNFNLQNNQKILYQIPQIILYPNKQKLNENILYKKYNWMIGGEIYYLKNNLENKKKIIISRLLDKDKDKKKNGITNINLFVIDDGKNNGKKIRLEYSINHIYGKESSRASATLIILKENKSITIDEQKNIINKFNIFINEKRNKYRSLFLTNYRESQDYARKRISFNLCYDIIHYLICNE